jgi:prolyl oligopeptidase
MSPFIRSPFGASAALLLTGLALAIPGVASAALTYPPAPRGAVVDTYFGTQVPDPYRALEDIDAPATIAWVQAERSLSRAYLDAIPQRAAIRERYRTLLDFEKLSAPFRAGKRWFFFHNSGLQNQSVLFVREAETGAARIFLDPNALSKDGTVALGSFSFTESGKYLAYSTQVSGSDWQTWHVRDVATNRDLPDTLAWSKFSEAAWAADRGFYYSAYEKPADGKPLSGSLSNQKLYFHALGTPQSADRLVYARPDHPDWFIGGEVTDDSRYLFVSEAKGEKNSIRFRDLASGDARTHELFPNERAEYTVIGHDGPRVYFQTDDAAPHGRLAWVDLRDASHSLHDILPERSEKLESVSLIGNRFYAAYLKDAHTLVEIHDLAGKKLGDLDAPGIGTLSAPGAKREDRFAYYAFASFTTPSTIYRYDTQTRRSTLYRRASVKFDGARYETEQVFVTSKDGTRVPMFIVHRKGLVRDGTSPTILYGYGGFNIPLLPGFSSRVALWLELGGTYAVANLRGGSEYGEAWHQGGMLANKQHVFDDFIAAAEYLTANGYTSTPKLAAWGGSNGGLLAGAMLTQRPDLFGAVIPEVGVLDMLRFQKFTVGAAWIPEYGSSEASAEQFATLRAYSPYHNIKAGVSYPPTLILTADHDDRVFPAHSFKFAAALQAAQAGAAPILISIGEKAGHGGGMPTAKIVEETADLFAFLVKNLGFEPRGL